MIGFVLKRVAGLAITLLLAILVVFLVLDFLPDADTAPVWQRFAGWLGGALLGDFGTSATANAPVGALIAERMAVTLPLAVAAMLLAVAIGLPLGVLAAWKRGAPADRVLHGATLIAAGVPGFWFGMLLVLLVSAQLRWLPSGGFVPWGQNPAGAAASLILPAFTLALPGAAILARAMRDAMVDAKAADFIRTAQIKGLSLRQAIWKRGLRNALLPVLAITGPLFALLIATSIVVENVFYLPGLGRLILAAVAERDALVIRGTLLALMASMSCALLMADLLGAWADPRLRMRSGP